MDTQECGDHTDRAAHHHRENRHLHRGSGVTEQVRPGRRQTRRERVGHHAPRPLPGGGADQAPQVRPQVHHGPHRQREAQQRGDAHPAATAGVAQARAPAVEHPAQQHQRVDEGPHPLVGEALEGGDQLEAQAPGADHSQDHGAAHRAVEAVEGVGQQVVPDPRQGGVHEGLESAGAGVDQGVVGARRGLVDDLGVHLGGDGAEGDRQCEDPHQRVAPQDHQEDDSPHRFVDAARDAQADAGEHPSRPTGPVPDRLPGPAPCGPTATAARPPGLAHQHPAHQADQRGEHRPQQGERDGDEGGVEGAAQVLGREVRPQGRLPEGAQGLQSGRVQHRFAADAGAPQRPDHQHDRADHPPAAGPRP